jgi:toxin YoeB
MKLAWTRAALEDYLHWGKTDPKIRDAINDLIADIKRNPFKGLGKPEPLKQKPDQKLEIAQCRYHY